MEEGVGLSGASHQPAVEAHPLGPTQGRGFHVVGTFNEGYAQLFQVAVAGILEGGDEHGIGAQRTDGFRIGAEAVAHAAHALGEQLAEPASDHVGRVGHAGNMALGLQVGQQGGVDRREQHHAPQRGAHHGARRQLVRQGLCGGNEHVGGQQAVRVPGIFHLHDTAAVGLVHFEQRGILYDCGSRAARGRCVRAGCQQQEEKDENQGHGKTGGDGDGRKREKWRGKRRGRFTR